VATGGLLSVRLGQIRRRLRLHAALEGAIGGAALAMLALAIGVALARGRGGAPGAEVLAALILLAAAMGASVRGARRIPLARCARLADAALDGQDRLLSALTLDTDDPSPFVRALVADAVRRAAIVMPNAAVPARRPAGLPVLGMATLALAGAALFPASSRAARVLPTTPTSERLEAPGRQAAIPAGALDAEREVARAAAETAARLADARLAALAADFDRALRRLASGALSDPAALDLLRALEARAAEGARAAKRDSQAAEAAARALEANDETRSAGQSLAKTGAGTGDDERASAALGASAAAHPAETARGLAAAAANLAGAAGAGKNGATGDGADAKDRPRRLSRDDSSAGTAVERAARDTSDPEARHLEQLRRDLEDAASACRAGDPGCRQRAEERGRDLEQLRRQGAARDSLQSLERSAEQLRTRVSRGELGDSDRQAMRSFGRAAKGEGAAPSASTDEVDVGAEGAEGNREETPSSRANRPGNDADREGDGARESRGGAETAAASAAMAAEGSGASEDQAGNGTGIGHQPGGTPLGARRGDPLAGRGTETGDDVPIRDGAGPGRAEVIGSAAGRGFASPGYARAFNDYAAAVEDALGATAVPEGKRYLVRRYFDLIRPRPSASVSGSSR
jgi:hypothetical protein